MVNRILLGVALALAPWAVVHGRQDSPGDDSNGDPDGQAPPPCNLICKSRTVLLGAGWACRSYSQPTCMVCSGPPTWCTPSVLDVLRGTCTVTDEKIQEYEQLNCLPLCPGLPPVEGVIPNPAYRLIGDVDRMFCKVRIFGPPADDGDPSGQ